MLKESGCSVYFPLCHREREREKNLIIIALNNICFAEILRLQETRQQLKPEWMSATERERETIVRPKRKLRERRENEEEETREEFVVGKKYIEKHTKEHVVKRSGYIFLPFLHLLVNSRIVCHILFFVVVGYIRSALLARSRTYRIALYNKKLYWEEGKRKKEQCIELSIEFCCLITISVNAIIYAYRHTSHMTNEFSLICLVSIQNLCAGPISSSLMRFIKKRIY